MDLWIIRLEAILIPLALALSVPSSRRVLVAWAVWATLRWKWRNRRPRIHKWLWLKTLHQCNHPEDR